MLKLSYNIIDELKKTIMKTKGIKNYYNKLYPNSKYQLKNIISDIITYLKNGSSMKNTKLITHYQTLNYHLQRFKKHDIFKKTYNRILKNNKLYETTKYLITDTSFINNCNGINKLGRNKYNKNKKAYKLSFVTDINGIPLDVIVKPSNKADITIMGYHLNNLKNKLNNKILLADAGYCSNNLRNQLKKYNCVPIIQFNNRSSKIKKSLTEEEKRIYKKRIIIENIFCYFKKFKNMKQMNMKYYSSYVNSVYLVLLCLFTK